MLCCTMHCKTGRKTPKLPLPVGISAGKELSSGHRLHTENGKDRACGSGDILADRQTHTQMYSSQYSHTIINHMYVYTIIVFKFANKLTPNRFISPPGRHGNAAGGLMFRLRFSLFNYLPFHSTTGARISTPIIALTPSIKIFLRLKIG